MVDASAGPPESPESERVWAESIYPEGQTQAGHTTVFGSYYSAADEKWGYACCKLLERDVLCPHATPAAAAEWNKILKRRAIREERARKEAAEREAEREKNRKHEDVGDDDEDEDEPKVPRKLEANATWLGLDSYPSDIDFIEHSCRHVLYLWRERQARGFEVKDRASVMQNEKLFKEAKNNISKFIKSLKYIEPDNVENMRKLFLALKEDNFAEANQSYMAIAIGKAAWVTGSTAQAGIFSGKEAGAFAPAKDHDATGAAKKVLMDDEGGKKFMFAVKRLINMSEQMHAEK